MPSLIDGLLFIFSYHKCKIFSMLVKSFQYFHPDNDHVCCDKKCGYTSPVVCSLDPLQRPIRSFDFH